MFKSIFNVYILYILYIYTIHCWARYTLFFSQKVFLLKLIIALFFICLISSRYHWFPKVQQMCQIPISSIFQMPQINKYLFTPFSPLDPPSFCYSLDWLLLRSPRNLRSLDRPSLLSCWILFPGLYSLLASLGRM